jgi:putative transposase
MAQLRFFDGAGKKRGRRGRADRVGFVAHVARPAHDARHPVHVTMRRVPLGPSFRAESVRRAIERELDAVKKRGVVVVHYSIQDNHLHLMVEAAQREDLGRHMKLLFSRIAMTVNRVALRAGKLFADRHHRHELTTPTEVRRALVYILFNDRKHQRSRRMLDEASSAIWVTDWSPDAAPDPRSVAKQRAAHPEGPPITPPKTWLARTGWRRAQGGLLRITERPRS